MLETVLTCERIRLQVLANDWREAVQAAGELLVQTGTASSDYVGAMVETVETFGPYIVICPGLALAHARPDAGALAVGVSLVTLQNPVYFGHPDNDPVSVGLGLSATDHESHLGLLAELSECLEARGLVEKLLQENSPEKVLEKLIHH